MRFIQTSGPEITLENIEAALKETDPAYSLRDGGNLFVGDSVYAQLTVHRPGDKRLDAEIQELRGQIRPSRSKGRQQVLDALDTAQAVLSVQAQFQDRTVDETLEKVDPLWRWLFSTREGLVQADGEGYYSKTRLLLKVE